MMRLPLKVNNQSVDSSGITNDYKAAINEFIWNGFEANAHKVSVSFSENELSGINEIIISDDGDGINYNDLQETFGAFLSSQKRNKYLQAKSKVNKGKGRFSFNAFARDAEWITVYRNGNELERYILSMSSASKDGVDCSDPERVEDISTGTEVIFRNITSLTADDLSFETMKFSLLKEFAWFLYLYKDMELELIFNGNKLDYTEYINTELSETVYTSIEGLQFIISVIVWKQSITEKYCCYYFDENNTFKCKGTTTRNRNGIDFNHSVYVKSIFFNNKDIKTDEYDDPQMNIFTDEEDRKIFNRLRKEIKSLIDKKMGIFLSEKADEVVGEMINERKTFPIFSNDKYGQLRKKDLERITKEIYKLQPMIFYKLKEEQEKSLLGFINLLLESEEREKILTIIEQVVDLSPDQRNEFANMLKKTSLENIIDTIKLLEERFRAIEILRSIVFDLAKYANERDHIQKIIERHFWLFGEQYSLASADQRMQAALEGYSNLLYGEKNITAKLNPDAENERRMDIFLCKKIVVEASLGAFEDENIIVELKAPKIVMNKEISRQIEDYMDFVISQPAFNSIKRNWKFIAICTKVDDDIRNKYDSFKYLGKAGLINQVRNYEVYAFTWDDVIQSFENKYQHLLDKLNYDREQIANEIMDEIDGKEGREKVDALTKTALSGD